MRLEEESNRVVRSAPNGSGSSYLHKAAFANSPNGTHQSGPMNGSSSTNGLARPSASYFNHDREEVTRIIIQALTDLGYQDAAGSLVHESGFGLESPAVAAFRSAVIQGQWIEAEKLLFGNEMPDGGVSLNGGKGLLLREGVDEDVMRFWLRQQKFLELLEQRDTRKALGVLRSELNPLHQDVAKLHFLSSLLMCQTAQDVRTKAEWDGVAGESRQRLLLDLSRCISPSVMLPEHRLAVLLDQVKQSQIMDCLYHNTATSPSLYHDHLCDRENFPSHTILELDQHKGEVWQVQFSHDGTRLATCGGDAMVVIFETEHFEPIHYLLHHEGGVCSLAWSPDDTMLVTCSQDKRARLWNTANADILHTLPRFGEPVSSCVWAPDGQTFITGCLDKELNLCQWNLAGVLVYDWGRAHRIQDLAVSPNGNRLVAMDIAQHIHVYNFVTRELEYELDLKVQLSSISICQNSKYLLVNKTDGEARLLDLDSRETAQRYISHDRGGKFVIRSAFGGANESFVICGSEEGHVFIFHKETGQLVEKLEGHQKGCCNAVSWNPANPRMLASAGDDNKIRIWGTAFAKQLLGQDPLQSTLQSSGNDIGSNGW